MGYEMPNVVKTIIIPFQSNDDNGLTLEEYKNKYGIDLEELFDISIQANTVNIYKRKNCIYYVSYEGEIYPLFVCNAVDGSRSIIGCDPFFEFSNEKLTMTAFYRFNVDKTISYIEL